MKRVFADTQFWLAITHPHDAWKETAKKAHAQLGDDVGLITTEEVLSEFLTGMNDTAHLRALSVKVYYGLLADPTIVVLEQSHESFARGLRLYESRPDKQYSMIDCISMETMRAERIHQVLTHDHHFSQEGFEVLMHA